MIRDTQVSSTAGFRAPDVRGAGIQYDYGLASFDIRHVVHLSGSYELPFGHSKPYMSNAGGLANALLGGWTLSWGAVLQGGQPFALASDERPDKRLWQRCAGRVFLGE